MAKDEDLFAHSTMSFGEHLEELRVCLSRALIGLVLGCVVGLFVSDRVVQWIQTPVKRALQKYLVESARLELQKKYGEKLKPDMVKLIEGEMESRMLVVEEIFLERNELDRLTASSNATSTIQPVPFDQLDETLTSPTTNFVKTRMWRQAEATIQALNVYESFMIYLKAALVVGAVLASPYIFFQLWTFVAAGLYQHERRYVYLYMPMSLFLFFAGVSLAFLAVFDPVLEFLFSYNRSMKVAPDMRISDILSFVLFLPLGFGVSFQLPLVMLVVNRLGIVSLTVFIEKWRIAILAIFVVSMVLTPSQDPISMLLMAGPLTGLYFLGLGLIKWMPHGRNPFGDSVATK